jgi:hypothetical protein
VWDFSAQNLVSFCPEKQNEEKDEEKGGDEEGDELVNYASAKA